MRQRTREGEWEGRMKVSGVGSLKGLGGDLSALLL